MSSFDLEAFKTLFPSLDGTSPRDCLVSLARTAEAAERYEEMCKFMRELVSFHDANLNEEERNLLSVAYKNVIGAKRASWRTLQASGTHANASEIEQQLSMKYSEQVEKELKQVCNDVLSLLSDHLIPSAKKAADTDESMNEARVFYLKMGGDYCRYVAESSQSQEDKDNAGKYYKEAYDIAKDHLRTTHPIRLGLALNFSVCYYEILKDKQKACELAKSAFDEAISKLDKLQTNEYKDSTLIMQLLRDNLTLWTSNEDEDGEGNIEVEDLSDEEAA